MIGNHVCRQLYRGFESHSLRQISLSEELEGCASRRSRSARHFAERTKGFFKLIASVRSPMRGFEPIFFRKSRHCSGFPRKAIFSAWLASFMNRIKRSNRLSLFRSKAANFSRSSFLRLMSLCFLLAYSSCEI